MRSTAQPAAAGSHLRPALLALVAAVLIAALLPAAAPAAASAAVAAQAADDLFISEYVEGTSTNKALEIYNGTGAAVDLAAAGYNIQMFFNGSSTPGLTINLAGTVADGDVHVVVNSTTGTDPALLALADQTNGAGWFNGDDAVVLRRGTTVLDVIGRIAEDPGTAWGTAPTITVDATLRRKPTVLAGDPDGSNPFDPAAEWDGLPTNTFAGLGSHTVAGGDLAPAVALTNPADGAGNVALDANISITFSEPVTVGAGAFSLSCTVTGPRTFTVSGGPTIFILDPDGDLGAGESCTVTVAATAVSDVDTDDPPDTMTADHSFTFSTVDTSVCGDPATRISAVQGSGASTPMPGAVVSIEGVVVGDYQGPGQFGGFFVQEEDAHADDDPATSEGVFVFNTSFPVDQGDLVRVRGTVGEFNGQTEVGSVTSVQICDDDAADLVSSSTVTLPVPSLDHWERYEGMLVTVPGELTVTEVFTLARFGEVSLSAGGRLFQPTHLVEPGADAAARADLNARSRILLDDANNQQNIDPIRYPAGGLSASNTLRVGDIVPDGVTGVLEYRFSVYRIQPIDGAEPTFVSANPRPAEPEDVGGKLRVAGFNVLNYFNGDGLGGGFPTSRGASSPFEFARQRAKIIAALVEMDADIVALNEIENDAPPNSAIEDLVAGLNDAMGPGTYDFIDTGVVGTDEIKVALIYKPGSVTPVGEHAILTRAVDPDFDDSLSRPVVAQTFRDNDLGTTFTVAANHLKSKGSPCEGDPDTGDGQGNCNQTRTRAARALARWLASDPTGSGDPDFLIVGDLNSYAKEDPIRALEAAGYTNLLAAFAGDSAYSYVFEGQSGYLDHALASPALLPQIKGVTEWHTNADEPVALDYNVEFKSDNHVETLYAPDAYRSSDHDAVIVGLTPSWDFDGFRPPIVNPPEVNTQFKGSSAVSLTFSLDGFKGMDIIAEGYPRSRPCGDDGPGEPTRTPGAVTLKYHHLLDVYIYRWKTEKAWRGTCREFILQLIDGSEHTAIFEFRS